MMAPRNGGPIVMSSHRLLGSIGVHENQVMCQTLPLIIGTRSQVTGKLRQLPTPQIWVGRTGVWLGSGGGGGVGLFS